jgi:glycosyltransferase involved in cell wall biosynthesis
MLLDNGYNPAILVREDFNEDDALYPWRQEYTDLRKCIPFMHYDKGIHKDFEDRSNAVLLALEENLHDVEVVITHDIILQESYKEHNAAMRRYAASRPDVLWLHWIHSCPSPGNVTDYPLNVRHTPPPGYIIYPNASDKARVVRCYGLGEQEHRVKVSRTAHAIDPLTVWNYDRLTRDLVKKSDLLGGDVVVVYPASMSQGKQHERLIRLMAGVKNAGREVRVLMCDWQASGKKFQRRIDKLEALAQYLGVGDEVKFTSRIDDGCSQGVPRNVVLELMDLSNVYIHPSAVETYGLTTHEAMTRGLLCVLNHDFPPTRELWGESAIYMDFGSDRFRRPYPIDEQEFWDGEALRLLAEMSQCRALMAKTRARREWTPRAMWSEFEPLLYLEPVGE